MTKKNILFLILGLVVLYTFQNQAVTPFLKWVATSDFYLEEDKDFDGSAKISSDTLSTFAYSHCNHYIRQELGEGASVSFPSTPLNSWDIGGDSFVVNSEVEITTNDQHSDFKKYVCRIHFDGGNNADFDDWSIYGVSGLDL